MYTELKLNIHMSNDAFVDNETQEVARILRKLADKIEESRWLVPGKFSNLHDYNGNICGHVFIYDHSKEED